LGGSGTLVGTLSLAATPPTDAAERRQVTALFCNLVDSTAMSGALDPEIISGLIRRYQDTAAGATGRFGGYVAIFMGDGVLVHFGYSRAFGLCGPGVSEVDPKMLDWNQLYLFGPGRIYNVESSRYITEMQSLASGARNDIARPQVAHAMWSAVLL
jgi:class 3 adenylate cyclase